MTSEIWIARDKDGTLQLFEEQPEWREDSFIRGTSLEWMMLDPAMLPELMPGECRKVNLALSSAGVENDAA